MAPTITSPVSKGYMVKGLVNDSTAKSQEATPVGKPALPTAKNDTELATAFKSDLTDLRGLVTCSICAQLLYEPWTLDCGHTYCYSCLSNWFRGKAKKTCPECRSTIKNLPAPAYIVKQMVEVFIKREELLPADESIEQHQKRRAEEIADVDEDRNGPHGLFKGMFPASRRELILDEADGVFRCPRCLTEHEGGPTCLHCRLPVEVDYQLSDMEDEFDAEDLENLEVDLDGLDGGDFGPVDFGGPMYLPGHPFPHHHHMFHHHHHLGEQEDFSDDSESDSDLDRDIDDEDEDAGSLNDFVVPDEDDAPRPTEQRLGIIGSRVPIAISDDESDEGGAISDRRRRQRRLAVAPIRSGTSSPSARSAITVSSTSASEPDDAILHRAGWSPMEEANNHINYQNQHFEDSTSDEDASDTETIGNGESDDDDDDDDDDSTKSETPRYEYPLYGNGAEFSGDEDEDESGAEPEMDHDGDTEMSVSPTADRYRSLSVFTDVTDADEHHMGIPGHVSGSPVRNDYGYGHSESSRSASIDTNQPGYEAHNLGEANELHEFEDDSSDSSIVAAPRRRRQLPNPAHVWHNYDPRISMMFAEHQQARGGEEPRHNLAQLDDQFRSAPIIEPASRMRRRMNAYRGQPQRRNDPLRSSRSPSAIRVTPSASRSARHLNRW